jgi:hypothetical protein
LRNYYSSAINFCFHNFWNKKCFEQTLACLCRDLSCYVCVSWEIWEGFKETRVRFTAVKIYIYYSVVRGKNCESRTWWIPAQKKGWGLF